MSSKISNELAPAAIKTMKLKKHIIELHRKLGKTDDEAHYYMLREAEEYEEMEVPLTNIMRRGCDNEDQKVVDEKLSKEDESGEFAQ